MARAMEHMRDQVACLALERFRVFPLPLQGLSEFGQRREGKRAPLIILRRMRFQPYSSSMKINLLPL
jgi:hypothetical protein